MKRFFLSITIAVLLPVMAQAQKMPIVVKAMSVNNTSSGLKLAKQIKAELGKFPQFQIVSPNTEFALEMEVITLSIERRPMDVYTVNWYVNWLSNPYFHREFLISDVGYMGNLKTKRTARDIKQKTIKVLGLYQNVLGRMLEYKKKK